MVFNPNVPEQDRKLAERINNEALADPKSAYAGKFVGIGHGQVLAVADDLDQLDDLVNQVEPDPTKSFFFEAGIDYDEIEYI